MLSLNWSVLSVVLLLASLGSFSWGMRRFFFKPSGDNAGMKLIRACSSSFALIHIVAIIVSQDVSPRQVFLAAIFYGSALALFFWAIRTHGERRLSAVFSPDSPQHLVNWGPYRFVRHPFYSAYLLTWIAGFMATGRWWLLPTIVVMVAVYHHASQIEEEKFASSTLAAEYRLYRQSTGRFFPNPLALLGAKKEADAAGVA